jgi:hypothetical protein
MRSLRWWGVNTISTLSSHRKEEKSKENSKKQGLEAEKDIRILRLIQKPQMRNINPDTRIILAPLNQIIRKRLPPIPALARLPTNTTQSTRHYSHYHSSS